MLLAWQDGYLGQGPLELTSWPLLYSNRETGDQVGSFLLTSLGAGWSIGGTVCAEGCAAHRVA